MPRVALLVEYSGKHLHGSQYQVGVRTVQSELERALAVYLRSETPVLFSGRTDSGVHARGQVAHLDIAAADLDIWRLCWAVNGILARDICVRAAQVVSDDFHARFSATNREYVYRLLNRAQRSALSKDDHYFIPGAST